MKSPILVLASLIAASAFAANAADTKAASPKKELTPQQQRMSDCSHESKGMKGDEHKKFMSECLKGTAAPAEMKAQMKGGMKGDTKAAAAKPSQTEKMKTCNADAGQKKLKGDERKKFMSDCLKG